MQMLYWFVNNIQIDYVDLLWEGLHYSLEHPSTLIPYPRITKLIVSHYMTAFPEISRRVRDKYHNLEDDEMVKRIFNSGKNKAGVGMKIPSWMITDEMKLTEHYRMYAAVFGVDVPTNQSQPIESTQGTHRTISALGHLTMMWLKENQNEAKVKEHLMVVEIEKLVGGTENVGNDEVDNSISHSQNDLDTRLEPRSNMERPKVEKTAVVSQPVNVIEEEDESAEDDYELKRIENWKNVEDSRHTPSPTITRFLARTKFNVLAPHLQEVMEEALPKMVDDRVKELTKTEVLIYVAEGFIKERQQNRTDVAKMIADAIQQECDNLRA
ncbi:hypothetical protein Tco_0720814 [Tanacetum coccineum]